MLVSPQPIHLSPGTSSDQATSLFPIAGWRCQRHHRGLLSSRRMRRSAAHSSSTSMVFHCALWTYAARSYRRRFLPLLFHETAATTTHCTHQTPRRTFLMMVSEAFHRVIRTKVVVHTPMLEASISGLSGNVRSAENELFCRKDGRISTLEEPFEPFVFK